MPWLIDGNNLLGLSAELHQKDPGARSRLVQRLAAFSRAKRTKVVVVFDGDPEPGLSGSDVALGDVRAIFSGRGASADSRILRLLDAAEDPAGYTVVTTDRALGDHARHRRASVVTSLAFRRKLEKEGISKPAGDEPLPADEVARWEEIFKRGKIE